MWLTRGEIDNLYHQYIADYKQYLRLRGFGSHLNDWVFFRRGFLDCWLAPGFHRFWQLWNPGIGYFTYKGYLTLGGKRHKSSATLAVFLANGLLHNLLIALITRKTDFPLPFTFLAFGFFTLIARFLDQQLNLARIPKIFHLAINVALVIFCFEFGFSINTFLKQSV